MSWQPLRPHGQRACKASSLCPGAQWSQVPARQGTGSGLPGPTAAVNLVCKLMAVRRRVGPNGDSEEGRGGLGAGQTTSRSPANVFLPWGQEERETCSMNEGHPAGDYRGPPAASPEVTVPLHHACSGDRKRRVRKPGPGWAVLLGPLRWVCGHNRAAPLQPQRG